MSDQEASKPQGAEERRISQLAGISTAAMGYWKEGDSIHPDYDSVALRDVAKLYAKYVAASQPSASSGREELVAIIKDAQAILAAHLPPDGVPCKETISALLEIFDGPRSRAAPTAPEVSADVGRDADKAAEQSELQDILNDEREAAEKRGFGAAISRIRADGGKE